MSIRLFVTVFVLYSLGNSSSSSSRNRVFAFGASFATITTRSSSSHYFNPSIRQHSILRRAAATSIAAAPLRSKSIRTTKLIMKMNTSTTGATTSATSTHSNKKHIFLTGHPSVGKTTIIVNTIEHLYNALASKLPNAKNKKQDQNNEDSNDDWNVKIHGFYTEECRNSKGDRIGFDIIKWDNNNLHEDNWKNNSKNNKNNSQDSQVLERVPLSRSVDKIKKSDPHVGKYLVHLENIEQYAIPSIIPLTSLSSSSSSRLEEEADKTQPQGQQPKFELIILDEIGKMEMLCPTFLPTVMNTLDTTSTPSTTKTTSSSLSTTTTVDNNNCNNNNIQQIVFGTIPTPRYGRVIPAIEKIRARDDVMVLHVTKDNRDELANVILDCFQKLMFVGGIDTTTTSAIDTVDTIDTVDSSRRMKSSYSFQDMNEALAPFLYHREIGASSMNKNPKKTSTSSKQTNQRKKQEQREQPSSSSNNELEPKHNQIEKQHNHDNPILPCGPLISKTIPPKVLLVGETASEQPKNNPKLAYCERSMWKVLGCIHGIKYNPPKSLHDADTVDPVDNGSTTLESSYLELKSKVLSQGICVWDVLSNVHVKSSSMKRRSNSNNSKNKRQKETPKPNNIHQFIHEKYPSIQAICFIGKKAHTTYLKVCKDMNIESKEEGKEGEGVVNLIVLPSSSGSNSRMTTEEKAMNWKEVFSKYC